MKLTLDIPAIKNLLPSFEIGDFAVIHGSRSISFLSLLLCVKAQLPSQLGGLSAKAFFIDGANTFRLYSITRIAQYHNLNPKQVLDQIYIARAFTAYQMKSLITQKLQHVIKETGSKLIVISDIAAAFLDDDIQEEETQKIYNQIMAYLGKFAKENQVIIVATYPLHESTKRNNQLYATTYGKATVAASLLWINNHRTFTLEKHPHYAAGSAEFQPSYPTVPELLECYD
jgi:RecA/RadA recombinase